MVDSDIKEFAIPCDVKNADKMQKRCQPLLNLVNLQFPVLEEVTKAFAAETAPNQFYTDQMTQRIGQMCKYANQW